MFKMISLLFGQCWENWATFYSIIKSYWRQVRGRERRVQMRERELLRSEQREIFWGFISSFSCGQVFAVSHRQFIATVTFIYFKETVRRFFYLFRLNLKWLFDEKSLKMLFHGVDVYMGWKWWTRTPEKVNLSTKIFQKHFLVIIKIQRKHTFLTKVKLPVIVYSSKNLVYKIAQYIPKI